mmetsp:Transcript_74624/g.161389  ORF Transcript_74624/g.161389 Transcript_74624/m.161389 type:complete len:88 (-) Transcript_74624:114-377(-)
MELLLTNNKEKAKKDLKTQRQALIDKQVKHCNEYLSDKNNITKLMNKIDLDKNGKVEKEEFQKAFLSSIEEMSLEYTTHKLIKKLLL